jgi:hypothetical protein
MCVKPLKKRWKSWNERRIRSNGLFIRGGSSPVSFTVEWLIRSKQVEDVWSLFVGGSLVVLAIYILARGRNRSGTLQALFFGAAFMAVGSLGLMGLIAADWVGVSYNAVFGIFVISTNIWALRSPPSPSYPRWAQWAMLAFGAGFVLSALLSGVSYYWS